LELEDRIAELCKRAIAEKDPAAVDNILAELKAALTEYTRAARRMTLLHFEYFRKQKAFPSEAKPQTAKPSGTEDVRKRIENNKALP